MTSRWADGGGGPRVLELYCGIGGAAAALGGRARVTAALDIDRDAVAVYRANFAQPVRVATLDSIRCEELAAARAGLWWLSPPCQPFTRRGLGRDDADPRSRSLLHLLGCLERLRPRHLGLENVPGFAGSRSHEKLRRVLDAAGYAVRERLLCPTELGVPNRRRRFYLVASRAPLAAAEPPAAAAAGRPLGDYLDPRPDPALWLEPGLARRYARALDVVDPGDPAAVAACFTAAYGRSPVRSGSYLRTGRGLRRFSPAEILRLLGFPASFRLPPGLALRTGWRLAGNSLSVPAVRAALDALELREPAAGRLSPAAYGVAAGAATR